MNVSPGWLFAFAGLVALSAARADEPAPPAVSPLPQTAWAQAVVVDAATVVRLKLVEIPPASPAAPSKSASAQKPPAPRWREVTLDPRADDVSFRDILGRTVSPETALARLQEPIPLLVSTETFPDPFYLLTVKPETLVLVAPARLVSPRPPAPAPEAADGPISAVERQLVDLANAERKTAGARPLEVSPALLKAARQHAANMARQGLLEHTLDQQDVGDRVTGAGYKWDRCAENIARGQETPAETIRSWMDSPGHRDNLLHAENVHVGVAVTTGADGKKYWTMTLAKPR